MTDPVLKVSPPTGGQWELLITTNATTGGTHDKRTTTNFEHHATSAQARTGCGSGCTSRANSGLSNHACSGVRKPLTGSVGSTNAWGFSRGLGHVGFRISPEAVGKGASAQSWRAGVHNISSTLLCYRFSSCLRRLGKLCHKVWHEKRWMLDFDRTRNAANRPVLDALHGVSTGQTKLFGYFCSAAQLLNQLTVRFNVCVFYRWHHKHLSCYRFSGCLRRFGGTLQLFPLLRPNHGAALLANIKATQHPTGVALNAYSFSGVNVTTAGQQLPQVLRINASLLSEFSPFFRGEFDRHDVILAIRCTMASDSLNIFQRFAAVFFVAKR
jgi:hypothetical protein